MSRTVDPGCEPAPTLEYDDTLPTLAEGWKGWSLWRGETWFDQDPSPMMFRWDAKGVSLIMDGDSYSEDTLILVPPGELCSCWKGRTCKRHKEPSATKDGAR